MTPERLGHTALLLAIAALLWGWQSPDAAPRRWDNAPHDWIQRFLLPAEPADPQITVILVDDESLARLGQRWPLDRLHWARLLDTLRHSKPAAIALDAWFETPAPRAEMELAQDIADTLLDGPLGDHPAASALATALEKKAAALDGDRQLARALAENGRAILGLVCAPQAADTLAAAAADTLPALPTTAQRPLECPRLLSSLPMFASVARAQGGLSLRRDPDGIARRYPYFARHNDKTLPSLALAAAMVADPDATETLLARAAQADGGQPTLRPPPAASFTTLRFSDVLESGTDDGPLRSALADHLVLVGVSAQGAEDRARTALGEDVPGVLIHAAALSALRSERFLQTDTPLARGGLLGGLALLLLLALLGGRLERAGAVTLAAGAALIGWTTLVALTANQGALLPLTPVALGILGWQALRFAAIFQRGAQARAQARAIRHAFNRYLAPPVVEALIADPRKLSLGGERRDITAFFSDIQGFTALSEQLEPAELVKVLNTCLGQMTDIILEEGGIIDKYIGDAIVAMFGAPLDQPDHAERACRAALRCQTNLNRLQTEWAAQGLPPIKVRIGLNSGQAVVGNMGSAQRYDYTMLGDTVNLAARLEGANAQYGTAIMAGEATVTRCNPGAINFRELDCIRPKGKQQAVRVYEVRDDTPDPRCAQHDHALAAYRSQKWQEAKEAFTDLEAKGDPPASTFLNRIKRFETDPPPPDWDGVYTMTTK